jgi:hypothetical protein
MVNDRAQIYTIEGITAGVIMLVTAYLVLSTTTLFTPGDAHITDMQIEQTGNDVLAVMDTPDNLHDNQPNTTTLSWLIQRNQPDLFGQRFSTALNSRPGTGSPDDKIKYIATVFYRNSTLAEPNQIQSYYFNKSADMTGRENSIRVTRLVIVNNSAENDPISSVPLEQRRQVVLLEVILWRG